MSNDLVIEESIICLDFIKKWYYKEIKEGNIFYMDIYSQNIDCIYNFSDNLSYSECILPIEFFITNITIYNMNIKNIILKLDYNFFIDKSSNINMEYYLIEDKLKLYNKYENIIIYIEYTYLLEYLREFRYIVMMYNIKDVILYIDIDNIDVMLFKELSFLNNIRNLVIIKNNVSYDFVTQIDILFFKYILYGCVEYTVRSLGYYTICGEIKDDITVIPTYVSIINEYVDMEKIIIDINIINMDTLFILYKIMSYLNKI